MTSFIPVKKLTLLPRYGSIKQQIQVFMGEFYKTIPKKNQIYFFLRININASDDSRGYQGFLSLYKKKKWDFYPNVKYFTKVRWFFFLMLNNRSTRGALLCIFSASLWGVTGTVGQFLFQEMDVSSKWLASNRMFAAGILLLLYIYWRRGKEIFSIWKTKKMRRTCYCSV